MFKLSMVPIIVLIVEFFLFWLFEFLRLYENSVKLNKLPECNDDEAAKAGLPQVSKFVDRAEINSMLKNGKLFVLHENYLCDVTDYIDTHPGGRIHIEQSIGLDVSRCITGTTPINNNFLPYDHSYKARMHLMNLAFAELREDHGLVLNEKDVK